MNMTYCQFENTVKAMRQLIEDMNDAIAGGEDGVRKFLGEMSKEEFAAYSEIWNVAEDLLDTLGAMYENDPDQDESDPGEYAEWRDFDPDA